MKTRVKTGHLATGRYDEHGAPIRVPVKFKIPGRTINNFALEIARVHESKGEAVALQEAMYERLRLCIVEVDGEPVQYGDLENDKINDYLDEKQQDTIRQAIDRLTSATRAEARAFVADLEYISKDGVDLCRGSLPAALRMEHVLSPPNPDEEDFEPPAPKTVLFKLPTRRIVAEAQQNAEQFKTRSATVAQVEANLNMIRFSVVEVDGRPISRDAMRGDGIDETFDPKEQSLLVMVFELMMNAERAEVDDFLGTLGDPSDPTGSAEQSTTETSTPSTDQEDRELPERFAN